MLIKDNIKEDQNENKKKNNYNKNVKQSTFTKHKSNNITTDKN